jgi:hypothetical protein
LRTAHPHTSDDTPADLDLTGTTPLITKLDLPFVTVDLALRTDERWRT